MKVSHGCFISLSLWEPSNDLGQDASFGFHNRQLVAHPMPEGPANDTFWVSSQKKNLLNTQCLPSEKCLKKNNVRPKMLHLHQSAKI